VLLTFSVTFSTRTDDYLSQHHGCFTILFLDYMRVTVHRYRGGRMPETLSDNLDRYASSQRRSGKRVPKTMDADSG
jgi:hypothetical protein